MLLIEFHQSWVAYYSKSFLFDSFVYLFPLFSRGYMILIWLWPHGLMAVQGDHSFEEKSLNCLTCNLKKVSGQQVETLINKPTMCSINLSWPQQHCDYDAIVQSYESRHWTMFPNFAGVMRIFALGRWNKPLVLQDIISYCKKCVSIWNLKITVQAVLKTRNWAQLL